MWPFPAKSQRAPAATSAVDYVLREWQIANLRYPSAFKPLLFTLEPTLVLHQIGQLTAHDLTEVDVRLRRALAL